MSLARFAFDEALGSLWGNRRSNVFSILTIAVALFVFGVFAVAWVNARQVVATLQDTAEASVFLADSLTPAERAAIDDLLAASPEVESHRFVSRDEALRRFAAAFPDLARAAAEGSDHPLPASFDVRLRPGIGRDRAAWEALAARLRTVPGVTDVQYDRQWLDRLDTLVRGVRAIGLALSLVLALGAALTVTSAVRLALQARSQEIEIMQLVGAPLAAIRGPFVMEGVLQGAIGAVVALAALYTVHALAHGQLATAGGGLLLPGGAAGLRFLPWTWACGLLAGGVIVGCIGGVIASRSARGPDGR
jgi:cell division transport system permease protein